MFLWFFAIPAIAYKESSQQSVLQGDFRLSKYPYGLDQEPKVDFVDGQLTDYAYQFKIGAGAFSEVYLGYRQSDHLLVVLKNIKHTRAKTILREIHILIVLKGIPHIVQILDAIRDLDEPKEAVIVYQYNNSSSTLSSKRATKEQLRQLFEALNEAHKKGVMHRDIKGANILVDDNGNITVIDWGLSAFYVPQADQSCKMGTRYYKAPELLLKNKYYDFGIDIWAAGCILAQKVFQVNTFLKGQNNDEQLSLIVKLVGTDEYLSYIKKHRLKATLDVSSFNKERFDFSTLTKDSLAIDLLNKIFVMDHKQRITAQEVLQHPYFQA